MRDWHSILSHAGAIVRSYDTGVTLRQLFYRLVSDSTLSNTQADYGQLSSRSAKARRAGSFPRPVDRTRTIQRYTCFGDVSEALSWLTGIYRLDRTVGQAWNVYLGVEKDGLTSLLQQWFGDLGVRILALRGYSSQTLADDVAADIQADGRPAVLIYAGDFDPSGEDIMRDFVARVASFEKTFRIALTPEQVERYELPPQPGKSSDSRAAGFVRKHGALIQVEVDALPPEVLRDLYRDSLGPFFDSSTLDHVIRREDQDRAALIEQIGATP